MQGPRAPTTFRFADFELDVAAYQLRRRGETVHLERRPMDLLILLVERRNELVSRAEIVDRLWGDVNVDVDMGVNTAIRKVRQALQDRSDTAFLIETVPSKGYRFVGAVQTVQFTGPTDVAPVATLAVLPFENLEASSDHDYLAAGFSEEATTALGQIDPARLSVIGRTSVMTYKDATKTLTQIGRELGATYLVEGSIRAEGGRWRVTARLIRAADQVQIWSASYDSEPASMLEFQRELSAAIAEQIRLRLSPEHALALEHRRSRNPEAYDLYLRGRHLWLQLMPPTNRRAVEYYARATERDPQYALAWSGLADAFSSSPMNADVPPLEVRARARDAARRAVEHGPDLAESHASLAGVNYWLEWDWVAAERATRHALALDPGYVLAYRTLSLLLATTGRHDEARVTMRRARELDPLQPMNHSLSAHVALLARDHPTGLRFARQATVVGPAFWIGYYQLAWAAERLGEWEVALEALKDADAAAGGNSKVISLRGYVLAIAGRTTEALQVLSTLQSIALERYVPPYAVALVYCGLSEHAHALQWLERAYQAHDVHLVWLPTDPKWDSFRTDPTFLALIERCGFTRRA
jgi:TolB-like protein/Flp pilus assembly protein TadD